MAINVGGGIGIGGGINIGDGGISPVDPATNTGGFSLAVIAGMPQNLYPAVSVYDSSIANAQFIINPASTYGTPSGFTFLTTWGWTQFDSTYISVTTTTNTDDTATALTNGNNAVLGSVPIVPSTKIMFSVTHTVWSVSGTYDGVGVGSATTPYTGFNGYLGLDAQSIAVYDDGGVFTNNAYVGTGYAVFQTNGQIIDVAVDTVNNKMWYRVAGGAWQG